MLRRALYMIGELLNDVPQIDDGLSARADIPLNTFLPSYPTPKS